MAVLHDFQCAEHGGFEAFSSFDTATRSVAPQPCPTCATPCTHVYRATTRPRHCVITDAEATQVYVTSNPEAVRKGKALLVPPDPRAPLHPKFRALGYEKVSLRHASDMTSFEKRYNKRITAHHTSRSNMESD